MYVYSVSGRSDPRHTKCLNLTEVRRVKYIWNHENNVPSRLSPQWLCGNSYISAHDVQCCNCASCAQVRELPQSHVVNGGVIIFLIAFI